MPVVYTARTDLPERVDKDFYPTEMTLVQAAMARYSRTEARTILDIGAGDGRWGNEAAKWCDNPPCLVGVDIRELPQPKGYTHWHCLDYTLPIELALMPVKRFDLIVSNPPFKDAEKIIYRGWQQLAPNGRMIFLLPHDFQCGIGRYQGLWQTLPPVEVAPVARRIDFYGPDNPNTHDIYVWDKGSDGQCLGIPGEWRGRPIYHEKEVTNGWRTERK